MNIAYVTAYDSSDVRYWSGTGYYMAKSLEAGGITIHRIGPLHERFSLFAALKQRLYRRLFHKIYIRDRDPFVLNGFAKQVAGKLSQLDADIVFAPGPIPVAHMDCKQPLVIWTDAVFEAMVDFNPYYAQVCKESVRDAISLEKSAYRRAALAIFASQWAAQSAIDLYKLNKDKVKVVPFGANIDCDRTIEDINEILKNRDFSICRLLFVGVDWSLKRGDFAVKVAETLNNQGVATELHVVGCSPPYDLPDFVKVHGFLSKNTQGGRTGLDKLYSESHFLILPSKAECFGIVFAEASSFGLPSLATNVGGIPTAIRDGENGKLFSVNADPEEISKYIIEKIINYDEYKKMAVSSFFEYENRINWKVSGEKVISLLAGLQ